MQEQSRIRLFTEQIEANMEKIQKLDYVIHLIGSTKAGKSTFLHYLGQDPNLKSKLASFQSYQYFLCKQKPNYLSCIKIGQELDSCTLLPQTIKVKGLNFRDLPGCFDNRANTANFCNQRLDNQFYLRTAFKQTQNTKLLLFINYINLKDKNDQMVSNFLQKFTKMFQQSSEILKSSLLIISVCDRKLNQQNIKASIRKKYLATGSYKYQKILSYFVDNDKISLFYQPHDQNVDFSHVNNFLNKIKELPYTKSPQIKISLDPQTKLNLIQQTQQKKNNTLIMVKNIIIQYEKYLSTLKNQQNQLLFLKQKILSIDNFFNKLSDDCQKDEIIAQLQKQFSKYHPIKNQIDKFYRSLKYIPELQQIIGNKEIKLFKSKDLKDLFLQYLKSLNFDEGKIIKYNQTTLSYCLKKQNTISSFEINKFMNKYERLFDIFIFKANLINLSTQIKAQGKTLIIHADKILTPKDKKILICLKGNNGADRQGYAQNINGLPGINGQNGGSFYLDTNLIEGKGMQIDLRGGNGGRGQNCDFTESLDQYVVQMQKQAQQNPDENIFLHSKQSYGFQQKEGAQIGTHVIKVFATFNGQIKQKYSTQTKKAFREFYKLKPGSGGNPGQNGKFFNNRKQLSLKFKDLIKIIDSPNPLNGQNGKLKTDLYEGQYIRELIFCVLRQKGKKFDRETIVDIASKLAQQGALKMLFQISLKLLNTFILPIQLGISITSANYSDGWKKKITFIQRKQFQTSQYISNIPNKQVQQINSTFIKQLQSILKQ